MLRLARAASLADEAGEAEARQSWTGPRIESSWSLGFSSERIQCRSG